MKKLGVYFLALALAAAMVTALAGCGGEDKDKAKAQEYMEAGDAGWEKADATYDDAISKMQQSIVALSSGAGDPQAEAGMLRGAMLAVQEGLDAARVEYEKILDLNGVEDYKTYAGMMLDAIALTEEHLAAAGILLNKVLAELQSGAITDVSAYLQGLVSGPEFMELNAKGDAITAGTKEAKDFKKEKGL